MKKLFTILAAALFSVSMMAQTTVFKWSPTEAECVGTLFLGTSDFSISTVKIHTNEETITAIRLNTGYKYADKKFMAIKPASGSFKAGDIVSLSVCFNNSDNSKKAIVDIYSPDGQTKLYSTPEGINGRTSAEDPAIVSYTLEADADSLILGRGGNTATYVPELYVIHPAPVAEPVTEVTVSGATECYVEKTITLVATTDVTADTYKWAVNGVDQEDSDNKRFDFTPAAEGTYSIICYAKNANNLDWAASAAHQVVASVKYIQPELVTVDNDITWDFSHATTAQVNGNQTDTVIFANLDAEWAESFAADKLAGCAQYFFYNGIFQGKLLKFITTVPGTLVVDFSNTGSSARPDRVLLINDVETEYKSNSTDVRVVTDPISVSAGEILIEALEMKETPVKNQIRIYSVSFTKSGETAVENAEVGEKAVKVIENGQMFIIKNGVKYSIIGAEIR